MNSRVVEPMEGSMVERHRTDIDGLRALAVIPVVLFHAGISRLAGGFAGVDVFFVISGFLITGIIDRELSQGRFSIAKFYERRVRRIFPALFTMFAVVTPLAALLLLPEHFRDYCGSLIAATLFVSNFYYEASTGYFEGPSEQKALLHTWSLSVEEQFYILFPIYLWLARRYLGRHFLKVTCALTLGGFALSAWGVAYHPRAAFFLAPTRAYELLCGALVALGVFPRPSRPLIRDGLSLVGLVLIGFAYLFFNSHTPFPGVAALAPCAGTALVLWAGSESSSWAGRVLSARPLVMVGWISYSLYLWHWPVLVLAEYWNIFKLGPWGTTACLAAALGLAVLSYRWIERPFRSGNALLAARAPLFRAALAAMAVTVAVGGYGTLTHGAPGRFGERPVAHFVGSNWPVCVRGALPLAQSGEVCTVGDKSDLAPSVAVWGDSHADALASAVAEVGRSLHRGILYLSKPGCPPLVDVQKVSPDDGVSETQACEAHTARALEILEQKREVATVVLVARWPYYAQGVGFGADRNHVVRLYSRQDHSALSEQGVGRSLEQTVQRLIGMGKRVLLVEPFPEFAHPVADSLARAALYGKDPTFLRVDETRVSERNRALGEVVRRLEGSVGFRFLRMRDIFCRERVCQPFEGDTPFFVDNNHLGAIGTGRVVPRLLQALRDERFD
ncbi:MAG TPA: acyltransferase family protein [Polyangiaceae bacterium]|nr:acyltransferase family protein [Polyangiaceae bacterium]